MSKHPHKSTTHHEGYEGHAEHEHSNHGHPGHHLKMKHEGHIVGDEFKANEGPAPDVHKGNPMGHPGTHMQASWKPHGFGHSASQRKGVLRMSGTPGAHRIGARKK